MLYSGKNAHLAHPPPTSLLVPSTAGHGVHYTNECFEFLTERAFIRGYDPSRGTMGADGVPVIVINELTQIRVFGEHMRGRANYRRRSEDGRGTANIPSEVQVKADYEKVGTNI